MKPLGVSLLAVAVLALPSALAEEPVTESQQEEKPAAMSQEETMMAMMIPGQPVKGMKYAHRNEEDVVIMEFETEVARKIDDDHIEMENLHIVAFDDEGKKIDIQMPFAVLDINTRILTGKSQVVIARDDFEIVGESGEFNTKTRFAKMLGNVKMTILNTEILDQ